MAGDIVGVSGSLTASDVESAYRQGIFPMADDTGVITWHRPERRAILPILPLNGLHISRSLAQILKKRQYAVTFDKSFTAVVDGCADRPEGSWISAAIRTVYGELHKQGKAHSVEIWVGEELAGGLYGVHLGGAFFAESKFHRRPNMSKVALAELVFRLIERGFPLLEVQYLTPHLRQFGVVEISDAEYRERLRAALAVRREFA